MKTSVLPRVCLVLGLLAIASNIAHAGSVTLSWQPSASSGIAGYHIYYGTSSRNYQWSLIVPDQTTAQVTGLAPGRTYYFVARTINADGAESGFSDEVSFIPSGQNDAAPVPGLSNISTRSSVLRGNSATIGGFVIGGSENHTIIVRGLGPTLSTFGVPGVLPDPFLTLHQTDKQGNDRVIATNDNWRDTQASSINATGLAPVNDAEAAIILSLSPGSYTAVLTGNGGTSGVGLIEVYDLSSNTTSLLSNISTRAFVGVGNEVMVGGFIANTDYTRVVVRVLGPTLKRFGVKAALTDPVLTLFDPNGNVVTSNDNWVDGQAADIQIAGYAPPNNLESAVIVTRPAGNTTAVVQGKDGARGIALLEVYHLP